MNTLRDDEPLSSRLPTGDGLQTLQDESTARPRGNAGEVLGRATIGLCDSLWAASARFARCPQTARPFVLIFCGRPKRSVSMVRGMTLGMHQPSHEMRGSL